MSKKRIYLDNAATSWPKPESVYSAVDSYMRLVGAPAGRSSYGSATEASRAVDQTRSRLARLMAVDDPRRIIFAFNGTDALNMALHGLIRPGQHVVTTRAEHNSVLRPLRQLQENMDIDVTRVDCDGTGWVDPVAISAAMRDNTSLVALIHASNVTGIIQPVEEVSRIARRHGALLLVDAAQSLGQIDVNVAQLGADLVAAPGHKGLLGPLGTGLLYIGPRAEPRMITFREGGTGTLSEQDRQPPHLPEKFESGNLNVAGILGLGEGVQFVCDKGLDAIGEHHRSLTARLISGLDEIDGVTIHGPADPDRQVGLVSITVDGYDAREVAAALDVGYGIEVRSGLHCAPLIHEPIGASAHGGTVRFSLGPFNTQEDSDAVLAAMAEIARDALTV